MVDSLEVSTLKPPGSPIIRGSTLDLQRTQINLDFLEIGYSVPSRSSFAGEKQILHNPSGSFKAGELSAILGPSGAGKSTLLNILSGYLLTGGTGTISLNGHKASIEFLRKLSSYIMQDDLIQTHLTVQESMQVAADLKLGRVVSKEQKREIIDQILQTLGLEKHRHTRTEKLSGGQRKRISIALELVTNPPIILLDEPTTGLDIVATTQVVKLLRKLAREGRTVICTIHQPSATICEYFDQIYLLAKGQCVYQGGFKELVPFLSHIGYPCPKTHNPADFIIEFAVSDNVEGINQMVQEVQNGKLTIQSLTRESDSTKFDKVTRFESFSGSINLLKSDLTHSVSFSEQTWVLLQRKMLQQSRNMITLWIVLFHHIFIALILGVLFYKVGNNAGRQIENFKFLMTVEFFFMYTHSMIPILLFPLEIKLIRREYFNRWYRLKACFAALTVASIPSQIIFGSIFILISYLLTDQPFEAKRILTFGCIGLLMGFVSDGWGLTVGALFNIRNGSIVGPASLVPLLAVSVYGLGFGTAVEPSMNFLMSFSYLRYGLVGLSTSIYERNRTMTCFYDEEIYCHYKTGNLFLKDLGMVGSSSGMMVLALILFSIFHRLTAFFSLKFTLTTEFYNKILFFAYKLLRKRRAVLESGSP